jgi:hypothetical protein
MRNQELNDEPPIVRVLIDIKNLLALGPEDPA